MSSKLKKEESFSYDEFEVEGGIRQDLNEGRRINFDHITRANTQFDFIVENNVNGKLERRMRDGWKLWKDDSYGMNEHGVESNARQAISGVASVHVGECGGVGGGIAYLMHIPNKTHPAYAVGSTVSNSIAADGGHINDIEHAEGRKSIMSTQNRAAAGMGDPKAFKNKETGFDGLTVADVGFQQKTEVISPMQQQAEGLINSAAGINQISST